MTRNLFDLRGRVIGLTGGGGHLGRAMTLGLARAGAQVFICGRRLEPLQAVADEARREGVVGAVHVQQADVCREDELQSFLNFISAQHPCIDGWINNAADSNKELLGELTAAGVDESLSRSLTPVMMATQAVTERMQAGGSIVNIASMYGIVSPQPDTYRNHPPYHNPPAHGAAKAGIIQFTRYAACHFAEKHIRVNAVSPGPFPSVSVQDESPEFIEELKRRVPLNRVGQPEELVGTIIFLLSNASLYMTGQNLVVDGGWTAW